MTDTIDQRHQENMDYIASSLINKPKTADLISRMIEASGSSCEQVKVVFPTETVPYDEFRKELKEKWVDLP